VSGCVVEFSVDKRRIELWKRGGGRLLSSDEIVRFK
jgi:hypothetical protein